MIWNKHFALHGAHAFLSASKYHWLRYDDEKLRGAFRKSEAAKRGTELHAYAHEAIRLRRRQPHNRDTVNRYINDAISYRMTPEQTLFYSENCFGTPDAIAFSEKYFVLRISDLKTGESKASIDQLMIYAALFCLEYGYDPLDLERIELRIYRLDDVEEWEADKSEVKQIMDRIVSADLIVREMREELQS